MFLAELMKWFRATSTGQRFTRLGCGSFASETADTLPQTYWVNGKGDCNLLLLLAAKDPVTTTEGWRRAMSSLRKFGAYNTDIAHARVLHVYSLQSATVCLPCPPGTQTERRWPSRARCCPGAHRRQHRRGWGQATRRCPSHVASGRCRRSRGGVGAASKQMKVGAAVDSGVLVPSRRDLRRRRGCQREEGLSGG